MNKILFLITFLTVFLASTFAQTNVNIGTQNSVTGCDITIYDDGGSTGNYGSSHNYIMTVYPNSNSGRMDLEIMNLDIHRNDTLYVYDGATVTGTPLAALNNNTYNSTQNTHHVMATIDNPTGALTLRFKTSYFSTYSNHGAGFVLHATCVAACLPFQIVFDTARCSHIPILNPTDNYYYIDLCQDEPLRLAVNGVYSNSESGGYPRSDASTTFTWTMETNFSVSGTGLDTLSHIFVPGSGCEAIILAEDTLQCPVQQPITFRVRNSQNPIAHIRALPPICQGESFTPTIGYNIHSTVQLQEVGYTQHASLEVKDTVFLPDGANCPPYGIYYRSNVTFTEFAPNATITSANDILYVRIKMEHSAIEDLDIKIYCPNGYSSTILPHPNYQNVSLSNYYRVNLGCAYRPDGDANCNASLNPMGDPWNYVWSNNNNLGYQYASGNGSCFNSSNFHSHINPHWDDSNYQHFGDTYHSFSVDSTNVAAMTQVYHPYQSFNSLVGCPLNGNWYIQVQDLEMEDNGYIVEWELALDPQLLPSTWEYSLDIDTFFFTGNQTINGITLQPEESGEQTFSMTIIDDFACRYDTSVSISVYEVPEVQLGEDRPLCTGQSVTLGPEATFNNCLYQWSTGATTPQITVSAPGTYMLTASVMSSGTALCQSSDTVVVSESEMVTVTLNDEICAGHDYDNNGFNISANTLSQSDSYTATRTETASNGCDSVITLNLAVHPQYQHEFSKRACETYRWNDEDYTESGEYTQTFSTVDGCDSVVTLRLAIGFPEETEDTKVSCGSYTWANSTLSESGDYNQTFTSSYGCDSVVTLHLTVVDTFLRTYESNPDFCDTRETVLSVEGSFDQYVWSTGETAAAIFVTESGTYSVTASNYACERVANIIIPNCPLILFLPNAITPGRKDGLNDAFRLNEYTQHMIGDFSIDIFNRWGELVFFSNDKNFCWDGTYKGKLMTDNVFNYIIRCTDRNGKPHLFKGSITVL